MLYSTPNRSSAIPRGNLPSRIHHYVHFIFVLITRALHIRIEPERASPAYTTPGYIHLHLVDFDLLSPSVPHDDTRVLVHTRRL